MGSNRADSGSSEYIISSQCGPSSLKPATLGRSLERSGGPLEEVGI